MSVNSPEGFHWRRRVEFSETDMAGIAHFSSFIIYMEQAEHALLRSLGTSVFRASERSGLIERPSLEGRSNRTVLPETSNSPDIGTASTDPASGLSTRSASPKASNPQGTFRHGPVLTWPRVHCECDYFAPARFEDELDIFVAVARLGEKSVTYLHRMLLSGREVATGKIVAVCSMVDPESGVLTGIPIPEHLRELLSEYVIAPNR